MKTIEVTFKVTVQIADEPVFQHENKGLTEEELNRHFDAFFTTKRGKGGSGLGTHIMYNLVTQTLAGQIEAESAPGKGLEYKISFPLRK